jgi:hypothetical protein
VCAQNATARIASEPKPTSINSTTCLFKKQRLRSNPTFLEPDVSNNVYANITADEAIYDDKSASLCQDDSFLMELQTDDHSVDSVLDKVFVDTTEAPHVASDYECFTTSQKCISSLMYLLDDMECPDYAFQRIMDWAHQ